MDNQLCDHLSSIKELKLASELVCEECVKVNSGWVHLRTCQTCGVTLCCDQSPLKHMTAHFHQSKHPVIISSEPGERWLWCFVDETFAEY
ncbi:UBP-type zinc finger domain-containing protein [Pedobacter sp. MC2016-14]|uniref:UBP-type zinc finger domain-containing protein n=1 Tax=Pedobacter sp. MC2016-14 TaxID=2897327 RepID=UPI001E5DCC6E|nr:UBP-type zinc finger domain-containing protein [Pedobacter sp. MC2016-14]MCD0490174.1 UBP-type zinc finger domain-containing protein [Pedobacter sp. MC2016-14]